ncbi:MAG TPA: VOC family protein [Acidimicrobiales bacterium]|nr:VOC family protein [Acidimicrobiales bacterium]
MPAYIAVSAEELATLEGLEGWRLVLDALHAQFRAPSFSAAATLTSAIADAADAADHHPDIDLRHPGIVRVSARTHAADAVTMHDVELARTISKMAARAAAVPEPAAPQAVEICIDTMDAARIRPFWAAVLGYRESGGALVDPLRIGPPVWFQDMSEPRSDRDRFHIDVSVPHDQAHARLAATLSAGGVLVTDRFARSWWIVADADGNEACICTWQDRK